MGCATGELIQNMHLTNHILVQDKISYTLYQTPAEITDLARLRLAIGLW
jgi:hypothetical protein